MDHFGRVCLLWIKNNITEQIDNCWLVRILLDSMKFEFYQLQEHNTKAKLISLAKYVR